MALLLIEARFADKRGKSAPVDPDLQLDLFIPGEVVPLVTLKTNTVPPIQFLSRGTGTYYFVKIETDDYPFDTRGIRAVWSAKREGQLLNPPTLIQTYPLSTSRFAILLKGDVVDYVKTKLGFPLVSIELSDEQLATAVDTTMEVYNRYIPKEKWGVVDATPGIQKYQVVEEAKYRGVCDVQFIRKEGVPLISDPLFGREYPRGQQLDFNQYVLGISFFDTLLRVTSQEPEHEWDENEQVLWIETKGQSFKVSYLYMMDRTIDEVLPYHREWFRKMALAQGKEMLGRIRSKFGAIPGASAGSVNLDGEVLLGEAREEIERLELSIQDSMRPVPPTWE